MEKQGKLYFKENTKKWNRKLQVYNKKSRRQNSYLEDILDLLTKVIEILYIFLRALYSITIGFALNIIWIFISSAFINPDNKSKNGYEKK
jgi:hypothetical protein